jgi:hypothetical protein
MAPGRGRLARISTAHRNAGNIGPVTNSKNHARSTLRIRPVQRKPIAAELTQGGCGEGRRRGTNNIRHTYLCYGSLRGRDGFQVVPTVIHFEIRPHNTSHFRLKPEKRQPANSSRHTPPKIPIYILAPRERRSPHVPQRGGSCLSAGH